MADTRTSAKIYKNVTYLEFDPKVMTDLLFKNPITEEAVWAEGPQYISETDQEWEQVTIYDGGKAFGIEDPSVQGGFLYHYSPDKNRMLRLSNLMGFETADWTTFVSYPPEVLDSDFPLWENLDFVSCEDAIDEVLSCFQGQDFPDFQIQSIHTGDLEHLQHSYQYIKTSHETSGIEEPFTIPEPTKDDEAYFMHFTQMIDGIPLNNYTIGSNDDPNIYPKYSYSIFDLFYSRYGIIDMMTGNLVAPGNGTDTDIIGVSSAMDIVLNYYSKGVLLEEHNLESLELTYIQSLEKDGSMKLHPYWLARVSYPKVVRYPDADWNKPEKEKEMKVFDHLYFDAVTGEYFPFSISAQNQ